MPNCGSSNRSGVGSVKKSGMPMFGRSGAGRALSGRRGNSGVSVSGGGSGLAPGRAPGRVLGREPGRVPVDGSGSGKGDPNPKGSGFANVPGRTGDALGSVGFAASNSGTSNTSGNTTGPVGSGLLPISPSGSGESRSPRLPAGQSVRIGAPGVGRPKSSPPGLERSFQFGGMIGSLPIGVVMVGGGGGVMITGSSSGSGSGAGSVSGCVCCGGG